MKIPCFARGIGQPHVSDALESLDGVEAQASLCKIVGLHGINAHARCGAKLVLGLLKRCSGPSPTAHRFALCVEQVGA